MHAVVMMLSKFSSVQALRHRSMGTMACSQPRQIAILFLGSFANQLAYSYKPTMILVERMTWNHHSASAA